MKGALVIDTDPGVDDAIALMMALAHPETRVRAITTVAGNVDLEQVTRNAATICAVMAAADVPIHAGASKPLVGEHRGAAHYHGPDGLGDAGWPPAGERSASRPASEVLADLPREEPGTLTLLALGPLTNLAHAFARAPESARLWKRVVVMGGTIRGQGNVTSAAEFNAWCDPEAFDVVLKSGAPLELVSWETTLDHLVPWDEWARWVAGESRPARFARAITRRCSELGRSRGHAGLEMPDPLAAAVALDADSVLEADERHVAIETEGALTRGMTIVDERLHASEAPNVRVVRRLDLDRVGALVRRSTG